MNEFDIIQRFFDRPIAENRGVRLGIGDDAAVVRVPEGYELVLAMDTLISEVHFPADTPADAIGWKALAVNLSDLAAMGAQPYWATLSLTLPEADEQWLADFAEGFHELATRYDVSLIGGDLCRGPLSITVQAHGLVPVGKAIRRTGARPGDTVYVSGSLGEAGYALTVAAADNAGHGWCRQRLQRPEPRVTAGEALRDLATSAIDVSDGLAGDLGHILTASGVGAEVTVSRLPLSPTLVSAVGLDRAIEYALTAGDDYELCFTAAVVDNDAIEAVAGSTGVAMTAIGRIVEREGLRFDVPLNGGEVQAYRHFS